MTNSVSLTSPAFLPAAPDGAAASLAPAAPGDAAPPGDASEGAPQSAPAHRPFLNFVRYLRGDRTALGGDSYPLARQRAETALLATDRVLALLYRIEAVADQRADCDVAAVAKLPAIRDLAREAIAGHTGAPFDNPLFPLRQPPPP